MISFENHRGVRGPGGNTPLSADGMDNWFGWLVLCQLKSLTLGCSPRSMSPCVELSLRRPVFFTLFGSSFLSSSILRALVDSMVCVDRHLIRALELVAGRPICHACADKISLVGRTDLIDWSLEHTSISVVSITCIR
jgi:hypothetical protein